MEDNVTSLLFANSLPMRYSSQKKFEEQSNANYRSTFEKGGQTFVLRA